MTGLRAGTNLSPGFHFVPWPLCHWPHDIYHRTEERTCQRLHPLLHVSRGRSQYGLRLFCPHFVPSWADLSPCRNFVPGCQRRGQIVHRPLCHWPQASFYRKNKEGRSGYLSLILSPFVPRGQIKKCLQGSQGAIRGQNALICPQNPLHSYTLTYTYPP